MKRFFKIKFNIDREQAIRDELAQLRDELATDLREGASPYWLSGTSKIIASLEMELKGMTDKKED